MAIERVATRIHDPGAGTHPDPAELAAAARTGHRRTPPGWACPENRLVGEEKRSRIKRLLTS
jgi:hypothetical protein